MFLPLHGMILRLATICTAVSLAQGLSLSSRQDNLRSDPPENATSFVIVVPEAKFAFCAIPKVASTDFEKMLAYINRQGVIQWPTIELANNEALGFDLAQVTKSNGWRFGYFVRDPLERYLSSWLSKCLPHVQDDGGANCGGRVIREPGNISEYVQAFEKRVRLDSNVGSKAGWFNPHWMTQAHVVGRHCGWKDTFCYSCGDVDFVETLSGDVNSKVKKMLEKGGVSKFERLADRFFPLAGDTLKNHATSTRSDFDLYYRDPDIALKVAQLYEEDYVKFRLPVPTIVEEDYRRSLSQLINARSESAGQ